MPDCVVLDANGLLVPFQFKVNIDRELSRLFGDIPVFVPSSVLGELRRSGDRHSQAALRLARRYKIVETELSGDEAIIDIASKRNAAVLTNDRELIRRLRELRIPVVRLRGEKYLVADDF